MAWNWATAPRSNRPIAATADLERLFPGAAAARAGGRETRFHWPSHPWSLGSYACLRPGDWTGLRGAMGESVGGLHFAGEHCALDTQGFMEGGCESGETAARAVLAQRGMTGAGRAWARRPERPDAGCPRPAPAADFRGPRAFCALQRASHITIPSRSPRIPTWGREQARIRFAGAGFLFARAHSGTHARIVAMTDAIDAHASRQLARLLPISGPSSTDPVLRDKLSRVAIASDFAIDTLARQPALLAQLAADDGAAEIQPPLLAAADRGDWPTLLRRYRAADRPV